MDFAGIVIAGWLPRRALALVAEWAVLHGAWSRRITEEHRLVHQVLAEDLVVLQARYHYEK